MHTEDQIAQAVLALVPGWLNGERRGDEWIGESGGLSWTVNLLTGEWSCAGSSTIEWYAVFHRLSTEAALEQVAKHLELEPIPEDAPGILPHPHLGRPTATYREGNVLVCRYETMDGTIIQRWTWSEDRWAPLQKSADDPWTAPVLATAEKLRLTSPETLITPNLLLRQALGIWPPSHGDKLRVARVLRANGWLRRRDNERKWWIKREHKTTNSKERAA